MAEVVSFPLLITTGA